MKENKTKPNAISVPDYIGSVADEAKRTDSLKIIEIIHGETGLDPVMWGGSIIGFGKYHYKYASGHEGDAPLVGFSPRTTAIVLYLASDFESREEYLGHLGKHKSGKGCIYIKKLADIDLNVLKQMIRASVRFLQSTYQ